MLSITFLGVSFLAGVLTVLAPCILPLLPVVVGSSAGARSRLTPLVVIGSLAASILVFTYLLKASTLLIEIPPSFWTYFSGGVLVAFGLILAFPKIWERVPGVARLSGASNQVLGEGYQKKTIWGDVMVGAALGPVFSTCSPTYFVILGTVLPESFLIGSVYLLVYLLGLSLVLGLIAFLGQKLTTRLGVAANPYGWFKRGLGILFVLVGLFIITGLDKQLEILVLDSGFFDITRVEQSILDRIEE